jgi:hypothetical protein
MSPSDAFITFYTLLLGLGLAALLTGFAGVLRRKRLRDVGVLGLLLCTLIVFEFLSGWAGALRTFRHADVNIASLALPFGTGACYFMASVLVFPEPGEIETVGVGPYICGQLRTIAFFLFTANLMLIGAEFPFVRATFATDPARIWFFYLPYNGAILACYAILMSVRSRPIAIGAMGALIAVYAWVTVTLRI